MIMQDIVERCLILKHRDSKQSEELKHFYKNSLRLTEQVRL